MASGASLRPRGRSRPNRFPGGALPPPDSPSTRPSDRIDLRTAEGGAMGSSLGRSGTRRHPDDILRPMGSGGSGIAEAMSRTHCQWMPASSGIRNLPMAKNCVSERSIYDGRIPLEPVGPLLHTCACDNRSSKYRGYRNSTYYLDGAWMDPSPNTLPGADTSTVCAFSPPDDTCSESSRIRGLYLPEMGGSAYTIRRYRNRTPVFGRKARRNER